MKTKQSFFSVVLLTVVFTLMFITYDLSTKETLSDKQEINLPHRDSESALLNQATSVPLPFKKNPDISNNTGKKINYEKIRFLGEPKVDYFEGLEGIPQLGSIEKKIYEVSQKYNSIIEKPEKTENREIVKYMKAFHNKYLKEHSGKFPQSHSEQNKFNKEFHLGHPFLKQYQEIGDLFQKRTWLLTSGPRIYRFSGRFVDEAGNPVTGVQMKLTKSSHPNTLKNYLKGTYYDIVSGELIDYQNALFLGSRKQKMYSTTRVFQKSEFAFQFTCNTGCVYEIELSRKGYYKMPFKDIYFDNEVTFGKHRQTKKDFETLSDETRKLMTEEYIRQTALKKNITKDLLTVTIYSPSFVLDTQGKLTRLKGYDVHLTSHVDGSGTVMILKKRREGQRVRDLKDIKKLPKTCIIFSANPNSKGLFGSYKTCKQLPNTPHNDDTYNVEYRLKINDPDPTAGFYLVDPLKKGKYHQDQRMRTAPESGYVRELVFGPDHEYQQGSFYVKLNGRYGKVRMIAYDYKHLSTKEAAFHLQVEMQPDGSRNLEILKWFATSPRLTCPPPGT